MDGDKKKSEPKTDLTKTIKPFIKHIKLYSSYDISIHNLQQFDKTSKLSFDMSPRTQGWINIQQANTKDPILVSSEVIKGHTFSVP